MSGINGLAPGVLQGTTLINLDSEEEGTFTIGSAGGEHTGFSSSYDQVPAPTGMASYEVSITGLKGGHSGVDIDLGRGHAICEGLGRKMSPFSPLLSIVNIS